MTATDFTDDERKLLSSLPHAIGSAMAFAAPSGIFGTGKEMMASAQAMLEGLKKYPGNTLLEAIVPRLAAGGDPQAVLARAKETRDWAVTRMKSNNVDSADKFRAQTLADAREVVTLLETKATPQQHKEYREWVMGVAEGVAQAATEGGFLGFGGERLSEGEKKLLGELRGALGMA